MSDIASSPTNQAVPTPIFDQLRSLRRQMIFWLLVDGFSRVLLVAIVLCLLDLGIDWLFHMDVAQRIIMLILMLGCIGYVSYRRLIRPLSRRPGDDALCLEIESRNKQLGESVISSLQFSRMTNLHQQGISLSMVQATIQQGAAAADSYPFGKVLNKRWLGLNLVLLAMTLMVIGAGAISVTRVDAMSIWFNRNILLGNASWPQKTHLVIDGIQPDGTVVMIRGEDNKQLVYVTEDSEEKDVEVFIEYRTSGSRTKQKMRRTGQHQDREFELTFKNVTAEFEFRALGGDDRTDWVRVKLIDPPMVEQLVLLVTPPEYTGQDAYELPQGYGPYHVLKGSGLKVSGKANKPLSQAALLRNPQQWTFELEDQVHFALEIPPDQLEAGKYVFDFVDQTQRKSKRPASFAIRIRADRVPRVRAKLTGISGMVVSRARIPIEATATDDFSVTDLRLKYNWRGDSSQSAEQEGEVTFEDLEAEFGKRQVPLSAVFDLEPEKIPTGAGLKFVIAALDNDQISGPKTGTSPEFLIRVVSEEELRTDLLRREKEQRQEFERLLKSQEDLLTEVSAFAADLSQQPQRTAEQITAQRAKLINFKQQQELVGTNVGGVASRLTEYLLEAKNNRLDEESGRLESRLGQQIIQPMLRLSELEIPLAQRELEASRRNLEDLAELENSLQQTVSQQENIIDRMKQILRFMAKEESYQEAINLLYEIEKSQKGVLDQTKKERERRIKEILEGGGTSEPTPDSEGQ